jgi:GTP-binding protein HflX
MGSRGPGETKIELDRRRINTRMAKLRREIKEMKTVRDTKRSGSRKANAVPSVAIAGYTNAGKSSLLNRLTGAGVLVENALFATLDPTVRAPRPPTGGSTPWPTPSASCAAAAPARRGVPVHPGGGGRRRPAAARRRRLPPRPRGPDLGGARRARRRRTGAGLTELVERIAAEIPRPDIEMRLLIPYDRGDLVHRLHTEADVLAEEHVAEGTRLHVRVAPPIVDQLTPYAE